MVSGAIIRATLSPSYRSLGLDAARRVGAPREVCALRPSPIGHKCAAGRGARLPFIRRSPWVRRS
jgi:hypothetical protein